MAKENLITDDARDLIRAKMTAEGRTLQWLSDMVEINYHTLYTLLVRKTFKLSQENLDKINKALGSDFTIQ